LKIKKDVASIRARHRNKNTITAEIGITNAIRASK